MAKSQYDRKELPVEVIEKLEEILIQNAEDLNEDDAAFLKARRDYLNTSEKERFALVLEVSAPAPVSTEKKLDRMNHEELVAKAISLGYAPEALENKKNKEIIDMINDMPPQA